MDRVSVGSSGSGRNTPRSLDRESNRSLTPGTLPTYQYSKDELYELQKEPASQVVPSCFEKEFMVDGIWDPEKWHRSFGGGGSGSGGGSSRGTSPLINVEPRERRIEITRRHSSNSMSERSVDPKERLKEEKDGIVLSPQRRSFGTGCHVTHQPLLQRAISNIVDGEREGRRDPRRIGSGRIQIDRDRGDRGPIERDGRDFRQERDRGGDREREFTRNDRHSERERGDFRTERVQERDPRDFRRDSERDRDFRSPRDRYEKDDRDRDTRFERDRDRLFISRRDLDERPRERDFRDFSNRHNNRRDRRDYHREEEPEWFSSGPVSKSDTIELHGFERERRESERSVGERERAPEVEEVFEEEEEEEEQKHEEGGISVADRNGSLETNESSSPETNLSDHSTIKPTKALSSSLFDFNEFFKSENIPGLRDDPIVDQELPSIGGSRFFQQYIQSAANKSVSRENSRRSSAIEDEFGYLNGSMRDFSKSLKRQGQELLNGSKSPVIPSPPPSSANAVFDRPEFLSPYAIADKQQNIEFGTVGGKVTNNNTFVTALINNAMNRASPSGLMKSSPQETEAKLKAILFGRMDSTSSSGNTTPGLSSPLNLPGKVKTLAELEGELQQSKTESANQQSRIRMTPPSAPSSSPQSESNDLSAFNKLMYLMQAGTARPVESPKLTMKQDPRPASPLASLTAHLQQQASLHHHHQQQQQTAPPSSQRVIHKPEPLRIPPQHAQVGRQGGDMQFAGIENMGTPTNMTPSQPNMSTNGDVNMAKKEFMEAIQRNKEQQIQLRQMVMQNMMISQGQGPPSGPPPQMVPPPTQQATPSQPQINQQQGMPQRRLSNGDPIMNFLKANPTIITKPASPTPPPQQQAPPPPSLNMVVQPRGPSPSPILQQALLSQQNPGSPRVVPSPIMFSQQPPMHLSAPSPIHPSQAGSLAQSPTTLQPNVNASNSIRPPSVPRVPSPQELIAHTQAILQNALIKKQLEDQKERFYKKQAERGKSPNPVPTKDMMPLSSVSGVALPVSATQTPSTPVNKTPVNVAFTPTSVIRKMHSEKANEKERQRRDSIDAEAQDKQVRPDTAERVPTISSWAQGDGTHTSTTARSEHLTLTTTNAVPPPKNMHSYPPPPLPNQVLPSMLSVMSAGAMIPGLPPFSTNQMTHLPPPPPPLISTHLPPPLLSPGELPPPPHHNPSLVTQEQYEAAKSQQMRALISQQQSSVQHALNIQANTSGYTTPGRPIIKGNLASVPQSTVTSSPISKEMLMSQRPIMGSAGTPVVSAVDMAKFIQHQQQRQFSVPPRTPTTPTTPFGIPITGRVPMQSTPMMGGHQPPTPGSNQILMQQVIPGGNRQTMTQLTQLANYQAQQRLMDPRGVRPPLPAGMVQQLSPRSVSSYPTPVSNSPLTSSFNIRNMNPNMYKNGPISPGNLQSPMISNGNNNLLKQETNLMKWFGSDMLQNQLPTMPPMSMQGQKVLTLDDIERS